LYPCFILTGDTPVSAPNMNKFAGKQYFDVATILRINFGKATVGRLFMTVIKGLVKATKINET
jgi:hypothetical protein